MIDKLNLWRKKLLNTGKRNSLLNFKETKRSTLKIILPKSSEFYSEILTGQIYEFQVIENNGQDMLFDGFNEQTQNNHTIVSSKVESELNKTLYQLRHRSKTALEEIGTNILYIAFGFLEWSEVEYSKEIIKSPLILVPVELKKESIIAPYTLSLFEDDIVINPNLCFTLENNFGVKFEFDFDLEHYQLRDLLDSISSKVTGLNWVVTDDVQLGLFSFLKLNMYKDLEKNESKIMQNEIIKALCGDQNAIEPVPEEIRNANDLDNLINPLETYQVVDADSSQQQAILAAKRGVSFVLQGPPGTGKSQTITNIIAECLAEGKRILFVSEKMAALEVVYRNLQKAHLEDFCLQLHSHKANKLLVVKELANTLNSPKTQSKSDLINGLGELHEETKLLNRYATALHEIRSPLEKSIFQVHGEIEKYSKYPDVQYKINTIDKITSEDISEFTRTLNTYARCVTKLGEEYKTSCFYGFSKTSITFETQKDFEFHLSEIGKLLNRITEVVESTKSSFSLHGFEKIQDLPTLVSLLTLLSSSPNCPAVWFRLEKISEVISHIQQIRNCYSEMIEKENEIFSLYEKEILTSEVKEMLFRFRTEYSTFFRIINSRYRRDKKFLDNYLKKVGYKLNYDDAINHLKTINRIHELSMIIRHDEGKLKDWIGDYYKGRETNWDYLQSSLNWITNIIDLFGIENISQSFVEKICNPDTSKISKELKHIIVENQSALLKEIDFINPFYDFTQFDIRNMEIKMVIKKFSRSVERIGLLSDWIDFINSKKACEDIGLFDFLNEAENKKILTKDYVGTFLKRFYLLWVDNIYEKEKILASFQREKFEDIISNFQTHDRNQFGIAQVRIRQKLSAQRPDTTGFTARGTEIQTLLREAEKRRKVLPVRKLFERIPNLLVTLKPCLLMSPLSVSLFLDPNLYEFDTVIFDEASQVCMENAIGAIYRGKQLIVVGDREQLPPTNFFNASTSDGDYDFDDDEDDAYDIDAYESILDECGSVLNKLPLLWHYRSRHEHLIAYSNAKIYKRLITFPTPMDKKTDLGVEFIHVPDGRYQRSTSRTNQVEAKRVVDLVFEHIEKHPDRSLGIVTFSEAQQEVIDNEILFLRKAKPECEIFFDEKKDEPFFIKNLENVQGDERDTIIFSVGYGKDETGKISMSFGPLNRDGGYRRLNVAITRAKYNVKLVSSILPTDINLSRTESRGVQMLRGYMDFAMRGMEAIIGEITIPEEIEFDSPFEMEVYGVLIANGYEVVTQLGCSGYKIDLAVRHPTLSGKFVIAIECDGATYHSAKTARERDRLRQDILRLRGWKIHRIWSTDWIRHRELEIERMLTAIQKAIKESEIEEQYSCPQKKQKSDAFIDPLEQVIDEENKAIFEEYKSTNIALVPRRNFSGFEYYLADVITKIVENETPIHKDLICRYLAPILGREKVTSTVYGNLNYIIKYYCPDSFVEKKDFLWAKSMKTPVFRVPAPGTTPRNIEFISPEEIGEGMKIIIKKSLGIEKNILFQEVARALGFLRTGGKITSELSIAFDQLCAKEEIEIENHVVRLK